MLGYIVPPLFWGTLAVHNMYHGSFFVPSVSGISPEATALPLHPEDLGDSQATMPGMAEDKATTSKTTTPR